MPWRVGNGNSPQYPYLENSMDRGGWCAILPGVANLDMTEQLNIHIHTHRERVNRSTGNNLNL